MGLRGQPPTPTAILNLRGSWRGKLNPGEPKPESGIPTCPKSLTGPSRDVWRKIVKMLNGMGVLTKVDGNQLERYCIFLVRWRECEAFIAKSGQTYAMKSDDPSCYVGKIPDGTAIVGFVDYPQVKESHRLDKALKQIEQSFGLTPSARTRISTAPREEADADGKGRFYKGA